MGKRSLVLCLALFTFATVAHADQLPVGAYTFSIDTPTTGVHSGSDEGTLSGTLDFDSASNLISADVTFDDTTSGMIFSFTKPGATSIDTVDKLLGATISNATDPSINYAFSIALPSDANGTFQLTCGTDCHNFVNVNDGAGPVYVEFNFGRLSPAPVPEPSSLLLLGTGALGTLGAFRRRLFHS